MPTVVVIHGTGVREPGYREMVTAVTRRLHVAREKYSVQECPWYKDHGVPSPPYQSLPEKVTFRAAGVVPVPDELLAWQGLYVDPLGELRELAESAGGGGHPTGAATFGPKSRQATQPPPLGEVGLGTFWNATQSTILEDEVTKKAIARGASKPDGVRLAVARGLVGALIRQGMEAEKVLPDGEQRDAWVASLRKS